MSQYPAGTRLSRAAVTLPTLTLGEVDDAGVEWYVETIEGWDDSPPTTGESQQRFREHGSWAPPWFHTSRQVNVSGAAIADSPAGRANAEDRLIGSVGVDDRLMIVDRELAPRQAYVRQNGPVTKTLLNPRALRWSLSLLALDPFRYSTAEYSLVTALPVFTGGVTFPVILPLTIGTAAATGAVTAVNAGNVASWARWRVSGPVTTPRVTFNGRADRQWWLLATLGVNDVVDIDSRTGDVVWNGSDIRTGLLRGDMDPLEPGRTDVEFDGDTYDSRARMTVYWRDSWK